MLPINALGISFIRVESQYLHSLRGVCSFFPKATVLLAVFFIRSLNG